MKKHILTLIGLAISMILWLSTIIFRIDLFEEVVVALQVFEHWEIDELIIPFFIFMTFVLANQFRLYNLQQVELEKAKVYKAMLFSMHHIMNNFLNQMYIFRATAEEMSEFPHDVLGLYDDIIEDAQSQIETLGNVSEIDEHTIMSSITP